MPRNIKWSLALTSGMCGCDFDDFIYDEIESTSYENLQDIQEQAIRLIHEINKEKRKRNQGVK